MLPVQRSSAILADDVHTVGGGIEYRIEKNAQLFRQRRPPAAKLSGSLAAVFRRAMHHLSEPSILVTVHHRS